jgi:uncharacterized integral membrane protein
VRHFARLVFIPLAIVVVVFAVANRDRVAINLWPLPFDILVPLYVAVLGALGVGVLVGGAVVWFGVLKWRRRARAGERRNAKLERELAAARPSASPAASGAGGAAPTALPPPAA